MMYDSKFVVAIKANSKVLRETKDLVQLPFGSEFSVLVKNLNSRRAKFKLHIDGTDVLSGEEIIVNANSEVEMKRFIRNGNMNEGNAFKFIERTQSIEDGPRGIKVDDGIVRVEFWFEKEPDTYVTKHTLYRDTFLPSPWPTIGDFRMGRGYGSICSTETSYSAQAATPQNATTQPVTSDIGITVPGSKVEQKFTPVYGFNAEVASHVIILRITGKIGNIEVATPVTVKSKQKCETCGHVNKATSKFCSECGTSLMLV